MAFGTSALVMGIVFGATANVDSTCTMASSLSEVDEDLDESRRGLELAANSNLELRLNSPTKILGISR